MKKILERETVYLRKIYNFDFDNFLIKRTVFVLNRKRLLKIKKSIFWTNSATYETNVKVQNCSFQKDLQILFRPFFDKMHSF